MLIAQISDTHIKLPGRLAYRKVDTAIRLAACVAHLQRLAPRPDLILITGDLVDLGHADEYAHLLSQLRPLLTPEGPPLLVIPGNHDGREAMRAAFPGQFDPAAGDFLQFARTFDGNGQPGSGPLRVIGLDTLVPGRGGGELCATRLAWLDATLAAAPALPTLVLMHHPPFDTGIAHMDRIGLRGREAYAGIIARHPQVLATLCGHLHRSIVASVGGRPALTAPSPAHQVALDLRADGPSAFRMEPPGYLLHRWHNGALVSHTALIDEHDGPFPFFDPSGALID